MRTEKTHCVPIQYNTYCKKKGILLDQFVFVTNKTQRRNDKSLNQFQNNIYLLKYVGFSFTEKCIKASNIVYCHHFYPKCDDTGDLYEAQTLCKETCNYFYYACSRELKRIRLLDQKHTKLIDCANFSWRNAGDSPECYYFDKMDDENGKLNLHITKYEKECLHKMGRGYQGNISVTSSGIPCQSWVSQCPHRHSMVSTYPELKNSSNYCRNSRGSGLRPWCFTSDKNKRWEYCDIPSCLPVNGGYGNNWILSSECSSTCGQGVEKWKRSCDAPAPRFGGNNCSSSANATEYRNCSKSLPPCPVNGNYGRWIRNSTCNATCGDGFQKWIRKCDNPTPAYGGQGCSTIGESVTLGACRISSCNRWSDTKTLKAIIGVVVAAVVAMLISFAIFGYRKMKRKTIQATCPSHRMIYMESVDNAQPRGPNAQLLMVEPLTGASSGRDI